MKESKTLSIILYVFAGLTAIFAIWTVVFQITSILPNLDAYLESMPFGENAYVYVAQFVNGSNGLVFMALALLLAAAGALLRRQAACDVCLFDDLSFDDDDDEGFFNDEDGGEALEEDGEPNPDDMFADTGND
ncbi:MAG: hypothetical protein FWH06_06545 [Oscillospiraceae bacterium]|nr:hypothetical protein [Oscillospiraceae bacterium]